MLGRQIWGQLGEAELVVHLQGQARLQFESCADSLGFHGGPRCFGVDGEAG